MRFRSFRRFPCTACLAAFAVVAIAGSSLAENLTNLSSGAASLLSQGTPFDVVNNPQFDYGANGRALGDDIEAAGGVTNGWTMNATFTPAANDLADGATRLIMEIGGTSNGTGLWLINGVPTLALKTSARAGAGTALPATLIANDLNITDNAAAIYSSFGKLTAGNEVTFAATWNADDTFTVAVQDKAAQLGVLQTAQVAGAANSYNWYGNSTFLEGDLAGATGSFGGLSDATGHAFSTDAAASFEGSFNGPDTLFWNESATLALTDPAKPVLTVTIDRATGAVSVSNPTSSAVTVNGYRLVGGRGGFDTGGGPEQEITDMNAGGLFTLAANGGAQSLGNVWIKSPFSDVGAQLDTSAGESVNALVTFSGPEYVFGDYDLSGAVDAGDWPTVLSGLITDLPDGTIPIAEYLAGDLTADGLVNRADFRLYKNLLSPADSAALFGVPEPTALAMLTLAGVAVAVTRCRRRVAAALLPAIMLPGLAQIATAADIYFVNNAGEIRNFTGVTAGANPLDAQTFAGGTLLGTVAAYGGYQDFTHVPDGRVFGVNSTGGVDAWSSISNWLANTGMTSLTSGVYGAEVATSPRSGLHGMSFDGQTGGFYVTYEGPDAQEGDLGAYPSLNAFANNANPAITVAGYNGNLLNFYYPDEDAPAGSIPTNPNAAPGSNYFQITGGGQLEGWLDLYTPGFGYVAGGDPSGGGGQGGNRSYQIGGFGNNVIAAFADVSSVTFTDLTLRVDTRTGLVSLKRGAEARDIDFIQIESPGGGLLPGGYAGLGGSGLFPDGNGTATSMGWDDAPSNATSTTVKAEAFAFGSSVVSPGASEIPLGTFYDTSQDLQDLVFSFDLAADGTTTSAAGFFIEYYESSGSAADVNGDSVVDGADFLQIQRTNPSLISTWQTEYGTGAPATSAAGSVPEPSTWGLALLLSAAVGALRVRRG